VIVLCTVIWCIARGSDVVSGELGRGTLEMLLAQPIRRSTLLYSHAVVSVVGLALLCLLVWAGIGMGVYATTVKESVAPPTFRIPFIDLDVPLSVDDPIQEQVPLRKRVDVRTYAASTFHLFAFGFFLLGLSSMLSAMDRYRWRTVGTVVGIYVLQLVMFALGKATEKFDWLLQLTFFSCYKPQKMTSIATSEGLAAPWSLTSVVPEAMLPPLAYPLILLILGLCFYVIASVRFTRRDLPAPL
jgi:ABC-2 type transport system permease protein